MKRLLSILFSLSALLLAGPMSAPLSPRARALAERAFAGLDPAVPVLDCHVHIIGVQQCGNGCEVNPELLSPWHPFRQFTSRLYLRASGVRGFEHFDQEYVDRLLVLAKGFGRPVHLWILAMDRAYNPDGTINQERTQFYVPNDYVVRLAEQHPEVFVPVISVHPARPDAVAELEKWAARGVRHVKWLPNAQGIDPADPRWDPFYKRMHELGMVLLCHTGEEQAVASKGAQTLGNPLRLRRALDAGVTVIMAHCASLGRDEDLDHPGKKVPEFDLFLRMMGEERYRGRLFGDLAAVTQINRAPSLVKALLNRPELAGRLLNGSDYPLPGITLLTWTSEFRALHMLSSEDRKALDEIHKANPLLFDFVLKRMLRDPKTGKGFGGEGFVERGGIEH